MQLLEITDVYGHICYVAEEDFNHPRRFKVRVPLRFRTGTRYVDVPRNFRPEGGDCIHRDNIAVVRPVK